MIDQKNGTKKRQSSNSKSSVNKNDTEKQNDTKQIEQQNPQINDLDGFKFISIQPQNGTRKTKKEKVQIQYEDTQLNKKQMRDQILDTKLNQLNGQQSDQVNKLIQDDNDSNLAKSHQLKQDTNDGKPQSHTIMQNENNISEDLKKEITTKKQKYNCKEIYEDIYKIIKEYRDNNLAPVDTMGCHKQGDETLDKNELNFQKLMSIILSVQTKDETTDLVMKKVVKEKLTIDKIIEMPDQELKEIIQQVNFNMKKVEYIKNAATIIKNKHNYVTPDNYEDLVKMKGIGPKVANLFLQCAYNKTVGIAVDTHVHRISNRLEWVETKTPEQTRLKLEEFIDKKYWSDINTLLVGFGQSVCKPINPQCQICPVNDKCPEGRRRLKGKKKF